MLKLTLKTIDELKLWPDEKQTLEKIVNFLNKRWIQIYLFGSRLNWYWKDIDLFLEWNIDKDILKNIRKIILLNTDTKIDIITKTKDTKSFIDFLQTY